MATAALLPSSQGNIEVYTLIWLDKYANDSQETIAAQKYLRLAINYFKIFKTSVECVNYIKKSSKDRRFVLIVSGRLGQEAVPEIHDCQQVSAIYVYCLDRAKNEQWAKQYRKIRHIITDLKKLVNKISEEQTERLRNKTNESLSFTILTKDNPNRFFYSFVFIECLLQTNSNLNDKSDFLTLCRKFYENNEIELKNIDDFQENYIPSKGLTWLLKQTFVARILTKSLLTFRFDILLLVRFFLHDIERILRKVPCQSIIKVYAGQILSNDVLQLFRTQLGQCLIMNSFLFANTRNEIEKSFNEIECSNDYQRVLFEIEADPRLPNIKSFGNIKLQRSPSLPPEEQTIFMCGSIFRIEDVRQGHGGMSIVKMKLCSNDELDVKSMSDQLKTEDSMMVFGRLFSKLKKFDQAKMFYEHLMKNLPVDHTDMVLFYDALGYVEKKRENYDDSLVYLKQAFDIKSKSLDAGHTDLADSYMAMGEVYQKKNEIKQAFEALNKALDIYAKQYPSEHPKIAQCYINLGHAYNKDKKYKKALECFEKAQATQTKRHTINLVLAAEIHNHIGSTYELLNTPDKALENYNLSVKFYEKISPQPHLIIGNLHRTMGKIFEKSKQFAQAQSAYEQALNVFSIVLSSTNATITEIQSDIQRVSGKAK